MSYISGFVAPIQPQTNAASDAARSIEKASMHALASVKLGSPGRSKAIEELNQVANARGLLRAFPGVATYDRAVRFLTALPQSAMPPELSVDPDGEIAFDWIDEENVLSVSLSATGQISFAADIGGRTSSGPAFFGGALPAEILEMLKNFE